MTAYPGNKPTCDIFSKINSVTLTLLEISRETKCFHLQLSLQPLSVNGLKLLHRLIHHLASSTCESHRLTTFTTRRSQNAHTRQNCRFSLTNSTVWLPFMFFLSSMRKTRFRGSTLLHWAKVRGCGLRGI